MKNRCSCLKDLGIPAQLRLDLKALAFAEHIKYRQMGY